MVGHIGNTARETPKAGLVVLALHLLLAGACWTSGARGAETEHTLLETGKNLGVTSSTGRIDDLRFTVDLQGDVPTATHVWATIGSNERRVRTNEGYWLPWNGDVKTLVDNRFPVVNGRVVFKVLDEDLGSDNRGVNISIGYMLGTTLKYGTFAILPGSATQ